MGERQIGAEGGSGGSSRSKQILGLAGGVALGALAVYGASRYLSDKKKSPSKPKEVRMSAPPAHSDADDGKKTQSFASVTKDSHQDQASGSRHSGDKDGKDKDGKDKDAHDEAPAPGPKDKPAPLQDEKVPEPGFDAPEDKMQDIGMSWRSSGNEVIIEALCPKDLQAKDLKCNFTTDSLHLEVAGKAIATGKLTGPIKPDECTWQFGDEHLRNPSADSKSLTVTLVKSSHKKWKELFQTAGPAS